MKRLCIALSLLATVALAADPRPQLLTAWQAIPPATGGGGWTTPYPMSLYLSGYSTNSGITLIDGSGNGRHYVCAVSPPLATNVTVNGRACTGVWYQAGYNIYTHAANADAWGTKPGTISMWIYPFAINSQVGGSGYQMMGLEATDAAATYRCLSISSSDKKLHYYYYTSGNNEWSSSATISTGVWTHIVVTSGAGRSKIFINGALDSTNALSWLANTGSNRAHEVGGNNTVSLNGIEVEFREWTNELTETQAEAIP